LTHEISHRTGVGSALAMAFLSGVALAAALPLCIGLTRVTRAMARTVANLAFPPLPPNRVDIARTPRNAFINTLQIVNLLVIGLALMAVTQPFLSPLQTTVVMTLLLLTLGVGFWRSTHQLEEHVRAGSLALVELLAKASSGKSSRHHEPGQPLEPFHHLFPGLGDPVQIEIGRHAACLGKTIAELNIRGRTGGIILAIRRANTALAFPPANEPLMAGDVLAVAGTQEAILAVRGLLEQRAAAGPRPA
jgi:CPA2 family monovalent cation:H+ antiporter-2